MHIYQGSGAWTMDGAPSLGAYSMVQAPGILAQSMNWAQNPDASVVAADEPEGSIVVAAAVPASRALAATTAFFFKLNFGFSDMVVVDLGGSGCWRVVREEYEWGA